MRDRVAQRVAEPWKLQTVDHITFGQVRGYLITLIPDQPYGVVITALIDAASRESLSLWLESREIRRAYRLNGALINENSLFLFFRNYWWTPAKVQELVELVADRLREAGARGMDHCAFCQQPFSAEDSQTIQALGGVAYAWHPDCVSTLQGQIQEAEAEQQALLPPVWRGWVGSLLGMVVGALLGALVLWYLRRYAGLAGMLAGLFCCGLPVLGYRLLGGRQTRQIFRTVAVSALGSLLLAHSLSYLLPAVQWLSNFGAFYGRTWTDLWEILGQMWEGESHLSVLLGNLLFSLLIYGCCLWDVRMRIPAEVTWTQLTKK